MYSYRPLSVACFLALASPAFADLTAEEVLADQVRQFGFFGLLDVSVQGENRSGNTLTIDGLDATVEIEGDKVTFSIGGYSLVEQGDGTVEIVYPENLPLSLSTPDAAQPLDMSVLVKSWHKFHGRHSENNAQRGQQHHVMPTR